MTGPDKDTITADNPTKKDYGLIFLMNINTT